MHDLTKKVLDAIHGPKFTTARKKIGYRDIRQWESMLFGQTDYITQLDLIERFPVVFSSVQSKILLLNSMPMARLACLSCILNPYSMISQTTCKTVGEIRSMRWECPIQIANDLCVLPSLFHGRMLRKLYGLVETDTLEKTAYQHSVPLNSVGIYWTILSFISK